ncbi:MAG: methyltransferase domain-containing protein [Deltaproteobacteria bacterium]|nr:methyltransferase domain-containing protein [Deltaproteobacteria bacterium]
MEDIQLLLDLHKPNARQGPGSDATTRQALELSGLLGRTGLEVADLGCGTGASAMVLAEHLDAHVTAVDLFPEFLEELTRRAKERGVGARITTLAASLDALSFEHQSLDAIWSEGAIYNIGFDAGIAAWRPFLRPGGVLALSEITWMTADRPGELQAHWDSEYPEIDLASGKLAVLERHGFTPIGYFPLPEPCWLQHYYRPLQARFPELLEQHENSDAARALVEAEEREIALYERHKPHISYGFYIARKVGA